jgi:aspartate kinase
MKVFKFGGASVKSAGAVRNVADILRRYPSQPIAVVVSAMGKTTNALEQLCHEYMHRNPALENTYAQLREYHYSIVRELFPDSGHPVYTELNNTFVEIDWILEEEPSGTYDFVYDQLVSMGEMLSSRIVSAYLAAQGLQNHWLDVRDCIKTDNTYREGRVRWEETAHSIRSVIPPLLQRVPLVVTQGFIGVTSENYTTTLGREGSDYSAAILAYSLDAEEMIIWKDVPGVLNADPKWFREVRKLDQLSYNDAIELSYYGASVIHPKTIKPLQNKNIPLLVKSFVEPEEAGTLICGDYTTEPIIPSYIFKVNQVLLSIAAKDFSFIVEENLTDIFRLFSELGVKINLMQNSAISFSVCIDDSPRVPELISMLRDTFRVLYNTGLELVTIRHYNSSTIEFVTEGKAVLLEQKSRHTAQLVMRDLSVGP